MRINEMTGHGRRYVIQKGCITTSVPRTLAKKKNASQKIGKRKWVSLRSWLVLKKGIVWLYTADYEICNSHTETERLNEWYPRALSLHYIIDKIAINMFNLLPLSISREKEESECKQNSHRWVGTKWILSQFPTIFLHLIQNIGSLLEGKTGSEKGRKKPLSTGGIFLVERFDGFATRVSDRKGLSEGRRDSCDLPLTVAKPCDYYYKYINGGKACDVTILKTRLLFLSIYLLRHCTGIIISK